MTAREHSSFVELTFTLADDTYPAIRISERLGCHLDLLDAIRTDAGETAAFFHVRGGDADALLEQGTAARYGEGATVVDRFDDELILKLTLTESVCETLADLHIPLQSLTVSEGTARFVATVPPGQSPAEVASTVQARHPSAALVGKQRRGIAAPFLVRTAFQALVDDRLTGRQLDAIRLAFEHGYFERPRKSTQGELAEEMGISPSTFAQHLHSALRKLLGALFADGLGRTPPPETDD